MTVAVLDIGVGNTASMMWALQRLGASATLTADPAVVAAAERVIFPGVGSAGFAARRLRETGIGGVLRGLDRPLLGVCLGMQMLFETSEEDDAEGLALLPGAVRRLTSAPDRPVPHMGWNQLTRDRPDDPLLEGIGEGAYVYFVHGYAAATGADTVASTDYGGPVTAVVRRGRISGCQFHPERSGATGARILRNFLDLPC